MRIVGVLGFLLVAAAATLGAVLGASRPAMAATTGALLIHAVEFQPTTDTTDFNRGDSLIGVGQFVARPKIRAARPRRRSSCTTWTRSSRQTSA